MQAYPNADPGGKTLSERTSALINVKCTLHESFHPAGPLKPSTTIKDPWS